MTTHEKSCVLDDGHVGYCQPVVDEKDSRFRCPSVWLGVRCDLPEGHDEDHTAAVGTDYTATVGTEKCVWERLGPSVTRLDASQTSTPSPKKHDAVDHPTHYQGKNGIEAVDVVEGFELGYHLGNVVTYVLRAARKNGLEDLKKGRWHLSREIERQEKESRG